MITFSRTSSLYPGRRPRVVFIGDSISRGVSQGPWHQFLLPTVEAALASLGRPTAPSGPWSVANGAYPTSAIDWINNAVSGTSCLDWCYTGGAFSASFLTANVVSMVTAYKPDIVINAPWAINCMIGKVASNHPSDAECTSYHLAMAQEIMAQNPGIQMLMGGPVCQGEQSPDGANANDTSIDAKDTACQAAATAVGATYVSFRAPFFALEAIVNPAKDNTGHLTVSGDFVHLNNNPDGGQVFVTNQVYAACRIQ